MRRPFDAVLVIAFGGPQGPADIRPFLANVLRGRRVAPERVEEVAHHYELFGGVSPLTALTMRQAAGLRDRLRELGTPLPVYVGMRNWDPFLKDTLAHMARDGVRHAIGFIAAAHRSYSSCTQYKENVAAARAELRTAGLPDVEITYVGDWHTDDGFVDANAEHIRDAFARAGANARLVFTAHSIPVSMAEKYPYERQLRESAAAVAGRGPGLADPATLKGRPTTTPAEYDLVFQSRSGRPEDPWLGPDICDYLRGAAARGLRSVVLSPIGFICDHVEVLYDLDVEAAAVAKELGITLARAAAVNDHPKFIETMARAVTSTIERYRSGRALQIVPAS
ncbi:MAG TPA: ferrochelatase [Vicinamibacterales bacterium]